jgi:hypothetical protein
MSCLQTEKKDRLKMIELFLFCCCCFVGVNLACEIPASVKARKIIRRTENPLTNILPASKIHVQKAQNTKHRHIGQKYRFDRYPLLYNAQFYFSK